MEENVQELLKDKNEEVVQFNFENNTSSPVAITLFDTASLITIPTSGTQQTTYTASNDLLPSLPPSLFAQNPNNGTFIASDLTSPILRLINTTTNTIESDFDNTNGFNGSVTVISLQTDGKILIGGQFSTYKGLTEIRIIRLNSDGSKDLTFDNSIGFNSNVIAIALQTDGKILVGGNFTTYKGLTENRIIRLNLDGTKDLTFDNSIGFNGGVNAIALQTDGKILIGGNFTTYKGLAENRIIRLNSDGSKDLTFDNSIGFNTNVFSIALQSDGKILVGGFFATYKGLTENKIIRLNSDGTKDLTFDNSIGFDGSASSIIIQTDSKIIVSGQFTTYKGLTENRIIRLNSDGSKDLTFDNSIGFNSNVIAIALQTDGKILVGGSFTTYKGYTNDEIIKLNSSGGSSSTLNLLNVVTSIEYNSVNNKFYAEYSSGIFVISSDAQTIEANVTF